MSDENTDMILNASDEVMAHWEQWTGGAAFTLGDGTTLEQFGEEDAELEAAALAIAKAADAFEMAEAHEMQLAGAHKKILAYPTAVENKSGRDSDALANCPYLAHQRRRRRRAAGGGTTKGLPDDVK